MRGDQIQKGEKQSGERVVVYRRIFQVLSIREYWDIFLVICYCLQFFGFDVILFIFDECGFSCFFLGLIVLELYLEVGVVLVWLGLEFSVGMIRLFYI